MFCICFGHRCRGPRRGPRRRSSHRRRAGRGAGPGAAAPPAPASPPSTPRPDPPKVTVNRPGAARSPRRPPSRSSRPRRRCRRSSERACSASRSCRSAGCRPRARTSCSRARCWRFIGVAASSGNRRSPSFLLTHPESPVAAVSAREPRGGAAARPRVFAGAAIVGRGLGPRERGHGREEPGRRRLRRRGVADARGVVRAD